jgi:hypothetical protein
MLKVLYFDLFLNFDLLLIPQAANFLLIYFLFFRYLHILVDKLISFVEIEVMNLEISKLFPLRVKTSQHNSTGLSNI